MKQESIPPVVPVQEIDEKKEKEELFVACDKMYLDLLNNDLRDQGLGGNLNDLRRDLRADLNRIYKKKLGVDFSDPKKINEISLSELETLSKNLEDFKMSEKFQEYQEKSTNKEEIKKEGVISKKEFFEKCSSLGLKKAPDDRVLDKKGDAFFVKDYSENTGIVKIMIKLPGDEFKEKAIESVEEFENLVEGVQDGTMTLREIFEAKPGTSKKAEAITPEVVDVVPAELKDAGINGKEQEAVLTTAVETARDLYAKKDYELTNAIAGIKNTLGRFFRPNQQTSQESKIYFANYKDALRNLLDHQIKELKKENLSPAELTKRMEVLTKYYNEGEQINLIEARTNAKTEAWESKYKLPNYLAKKSEKFVNGYRKLDWKLKMLASVGLLSAGVAVGIAGTAGFAGATGLASAVGVVKLMKRGLSGVMAGAGITGALEARYRKKEGEKRQKEQTDIIGNIESVEDPEAKYEAMKQSMQKEMDGYAKGLKTEKDKARSRRLFGLTAGILVGSGSYLFSHFNSAEIPTGNSVDVPSPDAHLETIGNSVDLADDTNANSLEASHLEEIGNPVDLTGGTGVSPDASSGVGANIDTANESGLRPDKVADLAAKKERFHNLFKNAAKVRSESGLETSQVNTTIPLHDPNFSVGADSLEEIGEPINLTENTKINLEVPLDNHEVPVGASSEIYSEKAPGLPVDFETQAGPSSVIASKDVFEKGFETNLPVENINGIEVAGKGDSVWKMIDRQLQGRYEGFSKLDPAIQAHIIDALKDKVANDPSSFGLENIDEINVGQEVDLSNLFKDESDITDMFYQAESLNPEELKNITENNAKIASWRIDNPDQSLTSAKVEEIIKNVPENLKSETLNADNTVELGMDAEFGNPRDIDIADSEMSNSEISTPKETPTSPAFEDQSDEASVNNEAVAPESASEVISEREQCIEKYASNIEATDSVEDQKLKLYSGAMKELSLSNMQNWERIKGMNIVSLKMRSDNNMMIYRKFVGIESDFIKALGQENGAIKNSETIQKWLVRVTKEVINKKE